MKLNYFLRILIIMVVLLTSCVSKKKYVEMETGRLKAEQEVRELTIADNTKAERIVNLIEEYEMIKNELLENNAIKDQYIDSLNNYIYVLSSDIEQASESLEESNYAFEFEKRRLNNLLIDREQKIQNLQQEIEDFENELSSKDSQLEQRNFDLRLAQNNLQIREGTVTARENEIEDLNEKILTLQNEISTLEALIEEKDAEITRLNNNVKLLKDELGN